MNTNETSTAETPTLPSPKPGSTYAYFDNVLPLDIKRRQGLDLALDKITRDAQEPVNIVVDLGAATGDIIKPWFADFRKTMLKYHVLTTMINPVTSKRDTVVNLADWVNHLRKLVDEYGVVVNAVAGDDFRIYDAIKGTFKHFEIHLEKRSDDIEGRLTAKHLSHLTAMNLWDQATPDAIARLGDLATISAMARVEAAHGRIQEEFYKHSNVLSTVLANEEEGSPFQHRMVVVAAGSGGIGKSTVARALVDYYLDLGITPIIFDGETEVK